MGVASKPFLASDAQEQHLRILSHFFFCSGKSHSFEMTISSKRACCVFESVFMSPVICHNVDQVRLGWF